MITTKSETGPHQIALIKMLYSGQPLDKWRKDHYLSIHPGRTIKYQADINDRLPIDLFELTLYYSEITDNLLLNLGKLHQLQVLHIQGCRQFADEHMFYVGRIKTLTEFTCDSPTDGSGIIDLTKCEKLKKLRMSITIDNLVLLNYLPTLQSIALSKEHINPFGMDSISPMIYLQELEFDNGNQHQSVDKIFNDLNNFLALTNLKIWNCPTITDSSLETIGKITSLKILRINKGMLTDVGATCLKTCTELQELELNKTQITDKGLHEWKALPKLVKLTMRWSMISLIGVKRLEEFPSLNTAVFCGEEFWNCEVREKAVQFGMDHKIDIQCPW